MPIAAGTRLGPYEVLASLGEGGMGQVYRARDTRLDRIVAIKVLAPHFAESEERRRRFQREARAVSSLNHPHIAALHDVGSENGTDYLVMECVEGQTLADRLKKGALPLDEAIRYGVQIADALDKAHRQGIVHRDLKPSNIMVTKAGVKLLDFGLAKLDERERGVVLDSSAPTRAQKLTEEGAILGTLQYIAPEQLDRKDVDARADLFALGGILYEMVTGRPAFKGRSPASLIAAILEHEPVPVSELAPTASPALDHAIERCLQKDPDERWQSAKDLESELIWIDASDSKSTATFVSRKRSWLGPTVLAAATLLAGFLGGVSLVRDTFSDEGPIRAAIPLGSNGLASLELWPAVAAPAVAISPNGKHVAYVGERADTTGIYLREINASQARWLDGTEGAFGPFFSPDGQWLGFTRDDAIWKVPVGGGGPLSILGEGNVRGASWGADGYVYFTPDMSSGLRRVSASGGEVEELTAPDSESREKSHRFPDVLPNGKGVLFTMGSADIDTFDRARIEVLDLDTGERRTLIEGGMGARYVSSGHIVYGRAGSLFAVPFDAERLEVTGTPVEVLEGVATSPAYGAAHFAVSEGGLLILASGGVRIDKNRLVWVDRDGTSEPIRGMERHFANPKISPDGSRLVVASDDGNVSIWIHDLTRGSWTRLVSGWDNMQPIWGPKGNDVTFLSNRPGPGRLFRKAADGSGALERLLDSERSPQPGSWSPDGSVVAYTLWPAGDVWALPVGENSEPYPLIDTRALEAIPEISPDGKWLAYVSDESGRDEVYVQPFPGPGPRIPISTDGGSEPAWNPSGEELFYREGDRMMVVEFDAGRASRPKMLFDASGYRPNANRVTRNYDVSPDGQRFLMIEDLKPEPLPDHLTLVVNWFEELRSHFPEE